MVKTKELSECMKAQIVAVHKHAQCSQAEIAKKFNVSQGCVSKLLKKQRETGTTTDLNG